MKFFTNPVLIAFLAIASLVQTAAAQELIPSLPCAFVSTTKGDASGAETFCLKVYNTCNTPITSTAREDRTGAEVNTPPIRGGDRGQVCAARPPTFFGHRLVGP